MQGTDRTFNFVISNSLTSLQTTMQTNLNLEMEKLQRRKSRADKIRTVGYKSFEFLASVSKKNRIFWDMGMDRKNGTTLVVEGRKVVHRAEVSFQRIHVIGFVHADVCRFHVTSGTSVWGGWEGGWKVGINYDETNERSFAKTEVIRNIGVICSLVRRKKKKKRKSQFFGEKMPREKMEEEEEEEEGKSSEL